MDVENAKPLLARTLSDTTGLASEGKNQEASKDIASETSETSSSKDTESSEHSSDGKTISGSYNNKIVTVPFTVGGSCAITVSISLFIVFSKKVKVMVKFLSQS